MKISNVYTQKEDNGQYNYRFEFKNITYKVYPSLMLHCKSNIVGGSMLSHLHEYTSLYKVKPYENIRG